MLAALVRALPVLALLLLGAQTYASDLPKDLPASPKGRTPLMLAARSGDLDRVEALLAAGSSVAERNANGGTPLMYAALGGDPRIVARLIEAGADPDARASNGWGALMIAAAKGHTEVARLLLAAGADINAVDVYGWTPLMRACFEDRKRVAAFLLEQPGLDLGATEERGATALHVVAQTGNAALAERLLRHGASREARTRQGLTPADLARHYGHGELAARLE